MSVNGTKEQRAKSMKVETWATLCQALQAYLNSIADDGLTHGMRSFEELDDSFSADPEGDEWDRSADHVLAFSWSYPVTVLQNDEVDPLTPLSYLAGSTNLKVVDNHTEVEMQKEKGKSPVFTARIHFQNVFKYRRNQLDTYRQSLLDSLGVTFENDPEPETEPIPA